MPIIQRNLFPARPKKKNGDGPSVLRVATAPVPLTSAAAAATVTPTVEKKSDNGTGSKVKKESKKLKHSTSLNSLLVSDLRDGSGRPTTGSGGSSSNKTNYDSHDSFYSSDTSSDPTSLSSSSSSSVDNNMISRRKILSRSRDALNSTSDSDYLSSTGTTTFDEDVWFNKARLISDHVEEIVSKWDQIDDEIWAKVICMERNRRVAKAYARSPILTINGCDVGFDGHRIGLNGFKNPLRDKKIAETKREIDAGIKIRMDEDGNLLAKRMSKSNVFILAVNQLGESTKIDTRSSEVLFDMKQFQSDLLRELKSSNPNPRALEEKCFCFISFGSHPNEVLNTPVWVIVINLVALEMLVKILPTKIFEDNFYSLPTTILQKAPNSRQNPAIQPPKLPPRDLHNKKAPLTLPEPDYDLDSLPDQKLGLEPFIYLSETNQILFLDDDPYYYGMSAHVPKFAHTKPAPIRPQPPIIRKALSRKFWPQPQPLPKLCPDENNCPYNRYPPILNPGLINTFPDYYPLPPDTRYLFNDNDVIYGVNPGLLRKNAQHFPLRNPVQSSSSPSLKKILFRKANKDFNNNSMLH